MPTQTSQNPTAKLLFIMKARLQHGLTRKEALMLWNDGITSLHDRVETITTTERGLYGKG
jgi:hypothetical protein